MSEDKSAELAIIERRSKMRRIFANFAVAFGPTLFVIAWEGGKMLLCGELTRSLEYCIVVSKHDQNLLGNVLFELGFVASGPTAWLSWKVAKFKRRGKPKELPSE